MNLTPGDGHIKAVDRFTPVHMTELELTLADDEPGYKDLGDDIKSTLIEADTNCKVWVSYHNPIAGTDYLADNSTTAPTQANAAAVNRVFSPKAGKPFLISQEAEFNRIHAVVPDGSGATNILIYKGRGIKTPEVS
jgi:hypothetical protein